MGYIIEVVWAECESVKIIEAPHLIENHHGFLQQVVKSLPLITHHLSGEQRSIDDLQFHTFFLTEPFYLTQRKDDLLQCAGLLRDILIHIFKILC